MRNSCSVMFCSNSRDTVDKYGKKLSFHRVPKILTGTEFEKNLTTKRRQAWFVAIGRGKDWTSKDEKRICSEHFITGAPANLYLTTHPDWTPSLNLGHLSGTSTSKNPSKSLKRYERTQDRIRDKHEADDRNVRNMQASSILHSRLGIVNTPTEYDASAEWIPLSMVDDTPVEGQKIVITPPTVPKYRCQICDTDFTIKGNFDIHVRNKHLNTSNAEEVFIKTGVAKGKKYKKRLICTAPECESIQFATMREFQKHLGEHHDHTHKTSHLFFTSHEEFLNWKKVFEEEVGILYVCHRGRKNLKDTEKQNWYCRRSGNYVPRGNGKRNLKSQGSVKIDTCCSSVMRVVICKETKHCSVEVYHEHSGHKIDDEKLAHMLISMSVQQQVAGGSIVASLLEVADESSSEDSQVLDTFQQQQQLVTEEKLGKDICEQEQLDSDCGTTTCMSDVETYYEDDNTQDGCDESFYEMNEEILNELPSVVHEATDLLLEQIQIMKECKDVKNAKKCLDSIKKNKNILQAILNKTRDTEDPSSSVDNTTQYLPTESDKDYNPKVKSWFGTSIEDMSQGDDSLHFRFKIGTSIPPPGSEINTKIPVFMTHSERISQGTSIPPPGSEKNRNCPIVLMHNKKIYPQTQHMEQEDIMGTQSEDDTSQDKNTSLHGIGLKRKLQKQMDQTGKKIAKEKTDFYKMKNLSDYNSNPSNGGSLRKLTANNENLEKILDRINKDILTCINQKRKQKENNPQEFYNQKINFEFILKANWEK